MPMYDDCAVSKQNAFGYTVRMRALARVSDDEGIAVRRSFVAEVGFFGFFRAHQLQEDPRQAARYGWKLESPHTAPIIFAMMHAAGGFLKPTSRI